MSLKEFKQKHILTICVIAITIAICAIGLACRNNKRYMQVSNNEYNKSFYELIDSMGDVENYLAKALITNDSNQSAETLMYIWRESNLASVYLSQIPISNEGLSNTQKFLNQASDYSYTLAKKSISDEDLTGDELKNLKDLYNYSLEVNTTLNQLLLEMSNGSLNWKELQSDGSSLFEKELKESSSRDGLDNIEGNFKEYDGLIYDGAYSEHITNTKPKGLTGEEIQEEKAKELVTTFIGKNNIKNIQSNGLVENGTIKSYAFEIDTNEENKITIAITQKGGHILFMNYNRNVEEEKTTMEEANTKALEFLNSKGYTNMHKTYYIKENGIITINYAYEEKDVIIYTDLIKVKIALDNGDVLGIETTGYLNNHDKRDISKSNLISENEAKKVINENLNIDRTRLAIIPTEYKTEVFCWELEGKVEDREFLVYVDAKTGKVADILIIVQTENGVLTQ